MSFKQTFEKSLNKELEEDHKEPSPLYPPPLPPIDLESQTFAATSPPPPPPASAPQIFPSYPEQRRGGIYIPTPLFILALLVLVFESSVLFVYTVVALYNTLPMPMHLQSLHEQQQPVNFAPNIVFPTAASTATITITSISTSTLTLTPSPTTTTTTLSASTTTTTFTASTSKPPVTVTKPAPTITVLSTVSDAQLPSITTETIFSTTSMAEGDGGTVTSTAVVTAG